MRTKMCFTFLAACLLSAGSLFGQCYDLTVQSSMGQQRVEVCAGSLSAKIGVTPSSTAGHQVVIITDNDGIILHTQFNRWVDVSGAPAGTCRVYIASFWGFVAEDLVGEQIEGAQIADLCYNLSSNYVEVVRSSGVEAGEISTTDETYICVDGNPDPIDVTVSNASGGEGAWIITDESGNILALPPTGPPFDLDGAGVGICEIWYARFKAELGGLEVGNNIDQLEGCFDLSNEITVRRDIPDGGNVTTADGATSVEVVVGDGEDDTIEFVNNGASNSKYSYVITDSEGTILEITDGNSQNFEGAPAGTCLVYGLAYTGTITAAAGQNAKEVSFSDDCFDLSDNAISVVRSAPAMLSAGRVMMPSGDTVRVTCPGDGTADVVMFDSSGVSGGASYAYIITDQSGEILGLPTGDSQDFEGAGEGVCLVWGVAYTGEITAAVGDTARTGTLSDGMSVLSENYIEVIRAMAEGGTVSTSDGASEVTTTAGDGMSDVIEFSHAEASAANYAYVITDTSGIILGLPGGNSQDFEGAGAGICLVWGLSYTGSVTAMAGDDASSVALSDECFDLSDNFVTVTRLADIDSVALSAGRVMMPSGDTVRVTCPGDGTADVVMFDSSGVSGGASYAYIITDQAGEILGLPTGDSQDFEGAGEGVCLVWGVAYTGELTAAVGDTARAGSLSDDMSVLSENYIEVIRAMAEGGTVATSDGATEVTTTAGDGMADVIEFSHAEASAANYAYVITDTSGIILGLPEGNSQDFEGAGAGICLVWGLSYTGSVTAMAGDDATSVALSDECFDLSDNFVTVTRLADIDSVALSAGRVMMPSGDTVRVTCPGDGNADVVMFDSSGVSGGGSYAYVITDQAGEILGLPTGDSQDFEGAGEGVCLVWGVAYTGELTAAVGDTARAGSLSDGMSVLSENYIEVIRAMAEGGTVSTSDGATEVTTTAGDGMADVIEFSHVEASAANYAYVITDTSGIILGLPEGNSQDFEGAGAGICLVWGLSYTGSVTAMAGDDATSVALSDECFDLSDNFVTVTRLADIDSVGLSAGTVATADGETKVYTCPGDGEADVVSFSSEGVTGEGTFIYVITDEAGVILGLPGDSQDFEGAGEGVCLVWGAVYTGELTAEVNDTAIAGGLSDGMSVLSENYIEVVRAMPASSTVSTTLGLTALTTTPGDSTADVIDFMHDGGSAANYAYIVTDSAGMILGLPAANSQDFEGAGEGVCLVYGVSFTGNITAEAGDNIGSVALSDGCFTVSDNSVRVTRQAGLTGGQVSMPSLATTRYTCPGDGSDDVVTFMSHNATPDAEFAFIITDENGVILGLPDGDSQNFEGAGEGVCYVWGLAYTGTLTAMVGDTATSGSLADGMSDLSDNFVTVVRATAEGGMVMTMDSSTEVSTTPGDGIADIIEFISVGASMAKFTYVITDTAGVILGIPSGNSQDFEGAGEGVCLVWGLSYTGTITAMVGDVAKDVSLSSECFDLSDNFITVNRMEDQSVAPLRIVEQQFAPSTMVDLTLVNPVRDRLEGWISAPEGEIQLALYSMDGQLLKVWRNLDSNYRFDFDANGLNPGVYVIQVQSPHGAISKRIIKQ